MLASVKHILPVSTIQRERLLPVKGRVLARKGQKVNPGDVVADGVLSPEHILLDIARGLGLRQEEADSQIHRHAGDHVDEGDVIAGPVGLGRRVVRSPKPGMIVLTGGGQVLMEVEGRPFELKAGFSGIVMDLIPERGVLIEATGALIQGVWGNGGMDYGLLTVLAHSAEDELVVSRLDVSMRGAVILGGYCADANVFTSADELPLRGLVLGSMPSTLIPIAAKIRCPVILLEGFGRIPINTAAYKLLSTSERREASLSAAPWDASAGSRPELMIALPSAGGQPLASDTETFAAGQQIRIIRAPYQGKIGTINKVLEDTATLPSGVQTQAARVRLENEEVALIPLKNLEVLK